jgi:hypothetical protein
MKSPNYRTGLTLVAMLFALSGCEKEPHADISTILARHADARGGIAALDAVQAIEVDRRIEEGRRKYTTQYVATHDGRMRLNVFQDSDIVFSEGFDGKSAWQRRGRLEPADDMPDWALAAVKRAVRHNLYALHQLAATGTKFTLTGRERVSGGLYYWVIEATDPDGYKRRLFIDPNTFLITRVQETSALNPDRTNYPTELDTYFSDFREVDGVIFSFKSEIFGDEAGQAVQTTDANQIVVNPEFDPAIFSQPEGVAAGGEQ